MNYYCDQFCKKSYCNMFHPPQGSYGFNQFNDTNNRFVYVKQQNVPAPTYNPPPKTTVLINPHFKPKVFINPNFKAKDPVIKPKIHVNPNMLRQPGPLTEAVRSQNVITKPPCDNKIVVSTKNKLIRENANKPKVETKTPSKQKIRRNSLHTKYKIVRSDNAERSSLSPAKTPKLSLVRCTKFSLVRKSIGKTSPRTSPIVKKKYVYVNRMPSLSFIAKNLILKQNTAIVKPGFVNINGILYKKSRNSLRKANSSSSKIASPNNSSRSNNVKSKYKFERKTSRTNVNSSEKASRTSIVRKQKLRSRRSLTSLVRSGKLSKNNLTCSVYRKYGKCKGKDTGACIKVHDPNQIILCTRFLQGACVKKVCLLSHKVSKEKMPTCKYYLEGSCTKDDCPYLHVKISPKADICKDFLNGFCKLAAMCEMRHQLLCPDFEKSGKCPRKRCPYPHKNLVSNKMLSKKIVKKYPSTTKSVSKPVKTAEDVNNVEKAKRYYKDQNESINDNLNLGEFIKRPKLGLLPEFIPLNK